MRGLRARPGLTRLLLSLALLAQLSAVTAQASVDLDQADGSGLTLEFPARSLVTLSPHLTELVFAAGAGKQIAATVEFSEFPAGAIDIPRIGDAFRLDIEQIVALRPELVIAWDSGNPRAAVQQLRSLGIPVWSVEIREPEEIADIIEAIGRATGHLESASQAALDFRTRLAGLASRYRDAEPMDYFYQVDARPLFTINGDHLISKGLASCGGHNIFQNEQGLAFQVAYESVIVANPDAMFAPWLEGDNDPLAAWRKWPGIQAVQQDALFLLNADKISRATPRLLDSLEMACKLLNKLRERNVNE